jgi:hypothetical protein
MTGDSRYYLHGWYVNGVLQSAYQSEIMTVNGNMTISPDYMKKWLVQVSSSIGTMKGSGWYNDGTTATIGVQSMFVRDQDPLGGLGVGWQFAGWRGYDLSIINGHSQVKVNSPLAMTAVWNRTSIEGFVVP